MREIIPTKNRQWGDPIPPPAYLTGTASTDAITESLDPYLGILVQPYTSYLLGSVIEKGSALTWAMDNGAFGGFAPDGSIVDQFDEIKFRRMLDKASELPEEITNRCRYVAIPDVPGNWSATANRIKDWPEIIRSYGFKPAMVFQDGIEKVFRGDQDAIPWDSFDVAFIGGSDDFKMGLQSAHKYDDDSFLEGLEPDDYFTRPDKWDTLYFGLLLHVNRQKGKQLHFGRVNSYHRYLWAFMNAADSVDGNYLRFGPDKNLPTLNNWIDKLYGFGEQSYEGYLDAWHESL